MKTVLILGGTGDIGQAIHNELSSKGLIVTSVGSKDIDLSNKSSIDEFLKNKNFDILIHSAGLNVVGNFEDKELHEIELGIDTNLIGFLHVVKSLLPNWKKQSYGRIVVISSLYGFLARKGRLPYVISKHGLLGAVRTLAIELAEYNILTNAVSPGYINTKMTTKNNSPEKINELVQGIPQRRLGKPEEIAKVVNFLVNDDNTYINGQDIVVDGGFSIGGFQK
jgi:3-oxoacyl-[acyl-carrier protein] reductase